MKTKLILIIVVFFLQLNVYSQTEKVNFSANITSGNGHVTVTFTNTSVGTFDYFIWNIFDKTVKYNDSRNFVYTFKQPGRYSVRLSGKSSTTGNVYSETKYQYIRIDVTQSSAYELTANEITLDANGYITSCSVTDFNTTAYNEGNIKIPQTINGQTVKGVTDDATGVFYDRKIVKLSMPNTFEHIGKNAFLKNYIQSITIPNGVHSVGAFAFCNNQCHGLDIPSSVQHIEEYAFFNQYMYGNPEMSGSGTDGMFVTKMWLTFKDASGNPDVKSSQLKYIGRWALAESGVRGYNTGIINGVSTQGFFIPPSVEEIGCAAIYHNYIKALAFTDGDATCPESKLKILREAALSNDFNWVNKPVYIPASIEIIEKNAFNNLICDGSGGSIIFEDESNLHYIGITAYGGNSNIRTPAILPTQAAANNTPGLWMNMNTGTLISPQVDGTYKLAWHDNKQWQAAYVVDFVDYDGVSLKTDIVVYGNSATPPSDPTRTGYTFTGWDTNTNNVTGYLTVMAQYDKALATEDISDNNQNIKIYPNPVSDYFTIELGNQTKQTNQTISIYNSAGIVMYHSKVQYDKQSINVNNYPSGVYFIKIENEIKMIIKK